MNCTGDPPSSVSEMTLLGRKCSPCTRNTPPGTTVVLPLRNMVGANSVKPSAALTIDNPTRTIAVTTPATAQPEGPFVGLGLSECPTCCPGWGYCAVLGMEDASGAVETPPCTCGVPEMVGICVNGGVPWIVGI